MKKKSCLVVILLNYICFDLMFFPVKNMRYISLFDDE